MLARLRERSAELGDDVARPVEDLARYVRLLDAIDGPGTDRRLAAVSLPGAAADAATGLGLAVERSGAAGDELFVAEAAALRTGLELLLLGLAGEGRDRPVRLEVVTDRFVTLDAPSDGADPRRCWELRYGRRVLEGQGCRVRLLGAGDRLRVEVRAGR